MIAGAQPTVAAAVVVQERRVLLVRRRVAEGSLSWQFPAGKVEEGESLAEAAVRETHEETGLLVAATHLLGDRIHPITHGCIVYFACDAVSGTAYVAAPEELAGLAWVTHGELLQYVPYGLFEPVQAYLDGVLTR